MAEGKERWEREAYEPFVRRSPERDVPYESLSGIPIEPLYTPEDLAGWRYEDKLGYPGEFPYTRGPYPFMYRGKLWTMRMFAGFGRPEDTNERFKYLLAQGQTGLSTAFDMPPSWVTTPIIRGPAARWARKACPSPPSPTSRPCSATYPSIRSRRP